MVDIGRKADIKVLQEDFKKTTDPTKRTLIEKAGHKIQQEQHDGWMRDARQRMMQHVQRGATGNVRDIQDTIIIKQRAQSSSFGFSNVTHWPFKNKDK